MPLSRRALLNTALIPDREALALAGEAVIKKNAKWPLWLPVPEHLAGRDLFEGRGPNSW